MGVSRIAFALFLAVGLLSGCGREPSTGKGRIAVFTADPSVVIARVGGKDITVADFRRRLDFETAIHKATMMKAKTPPKNPEKRLEMFADSRVRQILPQLVRCALIDGYLVRECGGREVTDAEAVLGKSLNRYSKKLRLKNPKADDLAREFAVDPAYLREQLLIPAREEKARLAFDPASTNVTEKEIDEGLARLDAYTERAIASNRVAWAVCSNALAKVCAGADFEATAKAFGADEFNEAKEWGWFSRDDFDMMAKSSSEFSGADFKAWAFKAKVGDIGGPFDLSDGLSLVKVVGHQDGTAAPSLAANGTEEVQLVRMTFPMMVERPEPRTREHCREALLNWKARNALKRLIEKLMKETEIAYPSGEKLDFKRRKDK